MEELSQRRARLFFVDGALCDAVDLGLHLLELLGLFFHLSEFELHLTQLFGSRGTARGSEQIRFLVFIVLALALLVVVLFLALCGLRHYKDLINKDKGMHEIDIHDKVAASHVAEGHQTDEAKRN